MCQLTSWSLVAVALSVGGCGARSQTVDDLHAARSCVVVDAGATDLGPRDLGAHDLGPRDLGRPDLGGRRDAGPPGELDLVGTWHRCSGSFEFGADGRYVRRSLLEACETTGVYGVSGRTLTLEVDGDSCDPPGPTFFEYEVVPGAGGLVLVGSDGFITVLADDATPRQDWALVGETGGAPQRSTLRVVDPARGPYSSACYWSADGRCGGLFSCSGSVANWRLTGSDFLGSTSCDGGCPCVAMSLGTVEADMSVRATFTTASCGGVARGTFVATRVGG